MAPKNCHENAKNLCFSVHFWGQFLGPLLGPLFGTHFYGFQLKVNRMCLIRGLKTGPFLGPFFGSWKRGWLDPKICINFKARSIPGCLIQARPWHQERSKKAHPGTAPGRSCLPLKAIWSIHNTTCNHAPTTLSTRRTSHPHRRRPTGCTEGDPSLVPKFCPKSGPIFWTHDLNSHIGSLLQAFP